MISAKVLCSNHPEEATLPLRWLCQLPLCGLAADGRLQTIIHRQQVLYFPHLTAAEKYRSFFISPKGGSNKMPVPHLEIRIIQRSKGSSAVAGAAYQAGEKMFSEYDQKFKDHRRKQHEVVYTEIMLPSNANDSIRTIRPYKSGTAMPNKILLRAALCWKEVRSDRPKVRIQTMSLAERTEPTR